MNTYEERKKLTGHMSAINSVAYNVSNLCVSSLQVGLDVYKHV